GVVPFLRQGKRDDNQNLVKEGEGVGGDFGEVDDAGGKDAEIQGAGGGDDEGHDERGSDASGGVVSGRLVEINGDHYSQIIVSADHAINGGDHHQPNDPATMSVRCIEGRLERKKLSEKASRGGQAEQREQKQREACGQNRLLRAEPGIVLKREALFSTLAEMRYHQECANFHQDVRGEIKEHSGDADRRSRSKRHQNVAGVRDRGISEHTFHVGLNERRKIADEHCENGGNPDGPEPCVRCGAKGNHENAQHERERRGLWSRSQKRSDRRRSAFVDVRAVDLEWRNDDLEAQADERQAKAENGQGGQTSAGGNGGKGGLNFVDDSCARGSIDHGNAVEKKCRGKGTEQEIFQRGFIGDERAAAEAYQHVR